MMRRTGVGEESRGLTNQASDAEANRAVGRLVAAGTPSFLLLPLLPKIGNALRMGATKAVDDPSERVAMMGYRDEPDPLLAFAADLARLVPDHHEWTLAWVDAELGLQAMQSLVASEPSPSEIGETLRSGRADSFDVLVPWYAIEQVDVLLGCPTGRTDVVSELVDGTWSDVDDPRPWSFVADVMHELQP